jgi:hypothetical protein
MNELDPLGGVHFFKQFATCGLLPLKYQNACLCSLGEGWGSWISAAYFAVAGGRRDVY